MYTQPITNTISRDRWTPKGRTCRSRQVISDCGGWLPLLNSSCAELHSLHDLGLSLLFSLSAPPLLPAAASALTASQQTVSHVVKVERSPAQAPPYGPQRTSPAPGTQMTQAGTGGAARRGGASSAAWNVSGDEVRGAPPPPPPFLGKRPQSMSSRRAVLHCAALESLEEACLCWKRKEFANTHLSSVTV